MQDYKKITELPSNYTDLELMDTTTILFNMNKEDQLIADAVALVIPAVTKLVDGLKKGSTKVAGCFILVQEPVVD